MTANEILEHIRQGGDSRELGVKALFDGFRRPMIHFFMFKGLTPDDAADLFQETVIKIVQGISRYHPSETGQAWIWAIARNALVDQQRSMLRQSRVVKSFESDEELDQEISSFAAPTVEPHTERVDECFERGFAKFESIESDRAYALLLQMEDKSIDEIAGVIGRTKAATKEYLSQCRKKLAPFLQPCRELLTM
jgi:RNA polymerase sigma factor (sigma-70 family)